MSVRRSADSVCLQYIWNAIEANSDGSTGSSFNSILSAIQSNFDPKFNASKLQTELSNALHDGCVRAHQGKYNLVEGFENIKKDGKDWYCFECHGPGLVIPCPTCFRVYHPECTSTACESHWSCRLPVEDSTVGTQTEVDMNAPPTHPCPVCKRLQRVLPAGPDAASVKDLQKVFSVALDSIRNRVHWKTMQKVGYLFEPLRNEYLVYQQINTKIITDRMRADPLSEGGYPNRTSLLVDLDTLVHNAAVFYGSKHIISNMARQIRSQLKRAMRESTYCIDCYLRPSTLSSYTRMTAACRKPHRLLWFQHNGWSFRPCKMLYESSEGYEVVCFGGRHEREFVSRARAFEMNFTAPDLGLRMTPSLKKALDEAEEYKANQSAYDRRLMAGTANVHPTSSPRSPVHLVFSNQLSGSKIPAAGKQVKPSNRKRRAGSKYESASTESSTSTQPAHSKRRRSFLSSTSSGVKKSKRESSRPTAASSSVESCTDGRDESSSLRIGSTALKDNSEMLNRSDVCISATKPGPKRHHVDVSATSALRSGAVSNHSSSSPVLSKTVIRIKPLPPPNVNPPPSSSPVTQHRDPCVIPEGRSCAKPKATPSNSSSSSALSGLSSGCATVPADVSLDDHVSALSSLSSASSLSSSNRQPSRSKRFVRPSKRNTADSGLHADCSSDDAENLKTISVQPDTPLLRSSTRFPENPNPRRASKSIFLERSSRFTKSPSSLSSLCDSDSSDSSALSRSPSPSSSDFSSTSVSTTPSSSRLTSFTNGPVRRVESQSPTTCGRTRSIPISKVRDPTPLRNKANSSTELFTDRSPSHGDGNTSDHILQNLPDRPVSLTQSYVSPVCSETRWNVNSTGKRSHQDTLKTSSSQLASPRRLSAQLSSLTGQHQSTASATKVSNTALSNANWPTLTRLSNHGSHTPTNQLAPNSFSNMTSTGPTPPSYSLSSSSCYSSVSPAALSTTSGLGSSMSDPKSVDASPGEVTTLLGNVPFSCSSVGHSVSQSFAMHSDSALLKSTEEQIHRIYADRLIALTAERDHAREELARRDCLIAKLHREHEAEIRRVKQMTWCQVCLNEAFYHCCPGTAYCSEACQLRHWTDQHNRDCRRRGETR